MIDAEGGIVAGHGRVIAAQSLGVASIPCLRVDWLTEAQKRAYVIADNQLALNAGWDEEILADELRALQGEDFDLSLIGLGAAHLENLLMEVTTTGMPEMNSADRSPFQQITFTLRDEQTESVRRAMGIASKIGGGQHAGLNANGNGNALALICETYITQNGQR